MASADEYIEENLHLLAGGLGWMADEDLDLVLWNRDEIEHIIREGGQYNKDQLDTFDSSLRELAPKHSFNVRIPQDHPPSIYWWWYLWSS